MEAWDQDFKKLMAELNIVVDEAETLNAALSKEDEKKLKKKMKKFSIEKDQTPDSAIEKTKKLLEQIYKNYEVTAKQAGKTSNLKIAIEASKSDRDSCVNQLKMVEGLQKQFKKKYDDTLKEAQEIQKNEEQQRKTLIQELQTRIKTVQQQYQASGKIKIQKYRQNQTLKHQLNKIQPQITTHESLMDAQLKKKQIEIEIQMTTLKQKIQMMNNFKKMSEQTKQKLSLAEIMSTKIEKRLQILDSKENQNKIVVTRAHLVLEDYRKAIVKINELLAKNQTEAAKAQQALRKKKSSMQDLDNVLLGLDKQYENHKNQIQILLNLQENLKKQLAA